MPDVDLVLSILLQSSIPACRAASTSTQQVANPASISQNGSINRQGKRKDRESNLSPPSLSIFLISSYNIGTEISFFGDPAFTV